MWWSRASEQDVNPARKVPGDLTAGRSVALLQGAQWLRCTVLGGFAAGCSVASLQGARWLRCRVLGGFAAGCSVASLQGARWRDGEIGWSASLSGERGP